MLNPLIPSFPTLRALLIPFLGLALAVAAQADQVVMKNGDRASGAIVKKDGDTLTLESKHFGTITLPWAEVESV